MVFAAKLKKLGVEDSDDISDSEQEREEEIRSDETETGSGPKYKRIPSPDIDLELCEFQTSDNPPKRMKFMEAIEVDKDLKEAVKKMLERENEKKQK